MYYTSKTTFLKHTIRRQFKCSTFDQKRQKIVSSHKGSIIQKASLSVITTVLVPGNTFITERFHGKKALGRLGTRILDISEDFWTRKVHLCTVHVTFFVTFTVFKIHGIMALNNTTESAVRLNGFYYARLVCYVIIFIVGVIGNVLVCLVVCRQRKMKSVTNYFIVNLAVADLAVLLICIPFDFGEIVTQYWPYGSVMCKLIYPLQTMATTASVGTLVAISLNRFIAIIYPLRPQPTTGDAKKVIFVVWLLSLALVSPYIAVLQHKDRQCYETFKDRGMNAGIYTLSIFILQYVLPLTLIGLSYIRIGRDLRRDKGSYSNDALQREQEKEAHKVVKVLTIVVIVFALLMLPNHIVFIWIDFGNGGNHKYIDDIVSLGQILVYFNSGTNPLIYNAVNEQFREGFRLYFQSWKEIILKLTGKQQNSEQTHQNGGGHCMVCSATGSENEGHGDELKNNNNTSTIRCAETSVTNDDATANLLTKV